jgi:TetR/AcrR family transcriptional regulator, transcriptional repressor for nem operon
VTLKEPEKRERLIAAAALMFHARGYEGTTLALVAADAAVPVGNVYYYFRTKDELALSVLDARLAELEGAFHACEVHEKPEERLRAFLAIFAASADTVALYGCPYGSLSNELARRDGELQSRCSALFLLQIAWVEEQFCTLGRENDAHERALSLVAAIQGACILSLSMRDPKIFRKRLKQLANQL